MYPDFKSIFKSVSHKGVKAYKTFEAKCPKTSQKLRSAYDWALENVTPPATGAYIYMQTLSPYAKIGGGSSSMLGTAWMPIPAVSTLSALIIYDGTRALLKQRQARKDGTYKSYQRTLDEQALQLVSNKNDPNKHLIMNGHYEAVMP